MTPMKRGVITGMLIMAGCIAFAMALVRMASAEQVKLYAGDGNVTIDSGVMARALGVPSGVITGTPSASNFLHGDGTWSKQLGGSSLPATCEIGDTYLYYVNNSWYNCSDTNVWTQVAPTLPATVGSNIAFTASVNIPSGNCCAANCTVGDVFLDTTGATKEWCVCTATDTWSCVAVTAGPAD